MSNTKEIHEGVNGDGSRVYMVVTVRSDGAWIWIERFDNEAEAICWRNWS